jgi:uroporphyrinogen decarboxylase
MRQAGRYLPEYRDLRARKTGFLEMVYDPKAACEVTLQPIRRFGMDGAILFSDILVIPQALGQRLEFREGEGPHLEPLRSGADLARLKLEKIHDTLGPVYETVANVRAALTSENFNHVTHIGFAGSPWTVACYMVEGHGSKEFMAPKTLAYADPALFGALIDLLVEATTEYLIRQVKAGAEVLQLFESWAAIPDAAQFKRWVIEPTKAIVKKLRAACPGTPIIGFPKGAGLHLEAYAAETGIDGVGLDSQIPPLWARDHLQTTHTVQGNLDPFCLYAGGAALENRTRDILDALSGGPFIFNLGHGINKDTPISHVERLTEILRG